MFPSWSESFTMYPSWSESITMFPSLWPLLGQLCADPPELCPKRARRIFCSTTVSLRVTVLHVVCSDYLPLLSAAQIRAGTLVARSTSPSSNELERHEQPVCWMVRTWCLDSRCVNITQRLSSKAAHHTPSRSYASLKSVVRESSAPLSRNNPFIRVVELGRHVGYVGLAKTSPAN